MAAGLGYKEFATGDVLTAADANGYLASQVVMVFASAAARTSAIASPQEGMISYLKDTNSTEYYSGSAWTAIGSSTLPAFSAYGSTSQTPSVNTWTKITFNTEEFDTASNFDTSNSRFTPTTAGYYQISGGLNIAVGSSAAMLLAVYKNGTLNKYLNGFYSGTETDLTGSVLLYLNGSTDYVELYGKGGAATVNFYAGSTVTWFTGVGVRA
jgi:hypothetical protein